MRTQWAWLWLTGDGALGNVKEQHGAEDTQTNILWGWRVWSWCTRCERMVWCTDTSAAGLNAVASSDAACITGGPLAHWNVVILLQPPPLQDLQGSECCSIHRSTLTQPSLSVRLPHQDGAVLANRLIRLRTHSTTQQLLTTNAPLFSSTGSIYILGIKSRIEVLTQTPWNDINFFNGQLTSGSQWRQKHRSPGAQATFTPAVEALRNTANSRGTEPASLQLQLPPL